MEIYQLNQNGRNGPITRIDVLACYHNIFLCKNITRYEFTRFQLGLNLEVSHINGSKLWKQI